MYLVMTLLFFCDIKYYIVALYILDISLSDKTLLYTKQCLIHQLVQLFIGCQLSIIAHHNFHTHQVGHIVIVELFANVQFKYVLVVVQSKVQTQKYQVFIDGTDVEILTDVQKATLG